MSQHLPALLVVLPLLAAPVCLLMRRSAWTRAWMVVVAWACLATAASLLDTVLRQGPVEYALGGWAAPWGIGYRLDAANAYVNLLVASIAAVVFPFGGVERTVRLDPDRLYLMHATLLLCLAGLLGMASTGDVFNLFVFLEITSLSSYALVALGRQRGAANAAFTYLALGTIGATFVLLAIGLIYQRTGTLNMADIAARLPAVQETRTVRAGFAFFCVGIGIKLAVFPLHQWLPNAYMRAPSIVSAFLAATATKVSYYVLVRLIFSLFGAVYVFEVLGLRGLLLPPSLAAMFVGSTAAIYQRDFKRLLAYSSIAQVGYMTLALTYATETGLTAGLVHLFNHALAKAALFLVAGCVVYTCGSTAISAMQGLGRRQPAIRVALIVAGLALVGVPGTAGFVSKWFLVLGALELGWTMVAVAILLSSLLSVVYVWRLVEIVCYAPPPDDAEAVALPWSMQVPMLLLTLATVVFGVYTDLTLGVARTAAQTLLGATP